MQQEDYTKTDLYNCKGCREDGLSVAKRCGITQQQLEAHGIKLFDGVCPKCQHDVCVHPAGGGQGSTLGSNPPQLTVENISSLFDQWSLGIQKNITLGIGIIHQDLKDKLPDYKAKITPTLASRNTEGTYDKFQTGSGIMIGDTVKSDIEIKDGNPEKTFNDAVKKVKKESDGYPIVQNYLNSKGLMHTYDISQGQYCASSNAYSHVIYTLRKREPIPDNEEDHADLRKDLVGIWTLEGRSDIVVLNRAITSNEHIPLSEVLMAIEVKCDENNMDGAFRAGIIELVGFNTSNTRHSPPVIVTNLKKTHYVLYITRESTDPLQYKVNVVQLNSFPKAFQFIISNNLLYRDPITHNLFRPPTPVNQFISGNIS